VCRASGGLGDSLITTHPPDPGIYPKYPTDDADEPVGCQPIPCQKEARNLGSTIVALVTNHKVVMATMLFSVFR
jgi:hypothetical protein